MVACIHRGSCYSMDCELAARFASKELKDGI